MTVQLYNTRTRKREPLQPLHPDWVGLYTCGPTVYSSAHIGNLRTYIFEDVLRRTLEFNGLTVRHVMNITDVGHLTDDGDMGRDKMEESAKRERKSAWDIAAHHTQEFFDDLQQLNIEPPTTVLKATETIDLQIDLIKRLETKGVTYRTSDGLYFDTAKFPAYGQLSRQKVSDKKAGARVDINTEKKHPTDFALWKFSQPNDQRQMEWPSPWGTGFPGWHIECSAMSMKELGEQFDIHTGGVDHIAVHHENEIAQSEAATGKHPFVNIWMHGEFLKLPGKRMGKSEGNAVRLGDLNVSPLAFRYLCLLTHYRKPLSFTSTSLEAAATALMNLWVLLEDQPVDPVVQPIQPYLEQFTAALNNDLNTPEAIGVMHTMMSDKHFSQSEKVATLHVFDRVLALDLQPETAAQHLQPVGAGYESLLEDYETARREKRFTISDKIRQQFADRGLTVEDLPDGTSRLRKQ
ncbi:MAG: cysteine--tRNA ligase [Candidatus Kerfeldbacteria bacterium]|nr:cysteine--tRNA ligase [Candidatus Kerfeldbacteria bacterium]